MYLNNISEQRCVRDYDCARPDKCCYDQCQQLLVCRPIVNEQIGEHFYKQARNRMEYLEANR